MNPSQLSSWSRRILALGLLTFILGAWLQACGAGIERTVLPNPSLDCKTDPCLR